MDARTEQGAGLARAHPHALLRRRIHAAFQVEVGGLAVDQARRRIRQRVERRDAMGRPGVEQEPEGKREHRVARQDRPCAAEDRPGGRTVVALAVAVHDVVVQQREGVHQLDRRRARQAVGIRPACGPGREQRERRTYRLPPAAVGGVAVGVQPPQVVSDDHAHRRGELLDRRTQRRCNRCRRALQHLRERPGHTSSAPAAPGGGVIPRRSPG